MPYVCAFDLDGTLIHSLPDICGNVNAVRIQRGLAPIADAELRRWIGRGVEFLMQGSFPEFPASDYRKLVEEFRDEYLRMPKRGGAPYPGVADALGRLCATPGIKVVIATNKHSGVAELCLREYFPGLPPIPVFGPDRVSEKKPSPVHLLTAIESVGGRPGRSLFVGDDPVDEECAAAAGVIFFGAGYGFGGVKPVSRPNLASFSELLTQAPLAEWLAETQATAL